MRDRELRLTSIGRNVRINGKRSEKYLCRGKSPRVPSLGKELQATENCQEGRFDHSQDISPLIGCPISSGKP